MRWLPFSLLRLFAVCLVAATSVGSQVIAQEHAQEDQSTDIRQWLDAEIPARKRDAGIPAVVIAVVHAQQTLLLGYGADPVKDVFRVGSVSKPVAAGVLIALAEQGALSFHEDIAGALQPLNVKPALEKPLTLHHLLTHTAGFNERLFGQHVRSAGDFIALDDYLRAHLPPRFIDPGSVIAYNDHHTALASWLAEQRTGTSFAELSQTLLFEPAGMSDSTFEQVDLPSAYASRRMRAVRGSSGAEYDLDFIQLPAAAGLYTTARDMARFIRSLLQAPEPQLRVQVRHHPELPGRAYGFAEGAHGNAIYFYKDGQASGFNARLMVYPAQQFGLFVAHNRNIFGPLGRVEAAGRFNRKLGSDLLNKLWPVTAEEGVVDPETAEVALAPYVGSYRTVVAARHTWERLISLFDEAYITQSDDGLYLGSRRFLPAGGHLFLDPTQPDRYIAFKPAGDVMGHVFIGGGAYERVPWWTTQAALPWMVGLPLVVVLTTGVLLFRRHCWLVIAGQFALVAFFVGAGLVFWVVDIQQLFYGAPSALLVLLMLPLMAIGSLAMQSIQLFRRFSYTGALSLAASLTLLTWLGYWNMLGYQLG